MSVTTAELADFIGKKVTIVQNLSKPNEKGDLAEEHEGTLVAAAGDAVMFKPKGKTNATLIDVAAIESITPGQEKAKALTRRALKVVTFGTARAHLLERHAVTLAWVNAATEQEAFDYHNSLNHEELDLGHVHKAKDDKKADDAAEDDGDDD